jgi:hypothetical protein
VSSLHWSRFRRPELSRRATPLLLFQQGSVGALLEKDVAERWAMATLPATKPPMIMMPPVTRSSIAPKHVEPIYLLARLARQDGRPPTRPRRDRRKEIRSATPLPVSSMLDIHTTLLRRMQREQPGYYPQNNDAFAQVRMIYCDA